VLAVVVDHRIEGGETAVVTVRGGHLDVAERRRLERSEVRHAQRHIANATVGPGTVPAQPGVGWRRDEEVLIALLHVAARAVAHEERLAAVLLSREILEILAR